MDSRKQFFRSRPTVLPATIEVRTELSPLETRQIYLFTQEEELSFSDSPAYETEEGALVRQLLETNLIFNMLIPWLCVGYPRWLVVLEARTGLLIPGWSGKPGDVDVLVLPLRDSGPPGDFAAGIEVKRVLVDAAGDLAGASTGTTQVLGLSRTGVDTATLLHILIQEPQSMTDGRATIQAAGPGLRSRSRLKGMRQIQALEREPVGYVIVGFGHLPGTSFQDVATTDWEIMPPPLLPWQADRIKNANRRRLLKNVRRFFFSAAHESGLPPDCRGPLLMYLSSESHRWVITAVEKSR